MRRKLGRDDVEIARKMVERQVPLAEPFDVIVAPRVSRDALVSFEGRQYSVPFAWIGRDVEVVGTARHVLVRGGGDVLARHERHTAPSPPPATARALSGYSS
jgi:hypothetical protein